MTPHKIIKSKRKTLSLSINENAELIVRAPNQISNKKIEEFIIEKSKASVRITGCLCLGWCFAFRLGWMGSAGRAGLGRFS